MGFTKLGAAPCPQTSRDRDQKNLKRIKKKIKGIKKKIKGSKKNKAAIDDPLTRNASRGAKTRVLVRFQSRIDDPLTRHASEALKP